MSVSHQSRRRPGRARRGWRLVSATGARVVSLRRLDPRTRARVMMPSLFTLGNMLCGFAAVLVSFQAEFRLAAVLIALAIVLDIADGAVARAVGAITPFGLQFDSLADLISFGIAPAVLVYTWALPAYPSWAWAGAMFWRACAAYRLARFNVTIDPMADKRYFIGLPSPGAASVVIATVFAIEGPLHGWAPILPVIAGVLPAVLMATSFRFRSFRSLISGEKPAVTAGVVLLLALGLVLAPGWTGIAFAYGYVLTCPLGWLSAGLRRRWFGPESVAPPRTRLPSVFLPISDPDEPEEAGETENDDAGNTRAEGDGRDVGGDRGRETGSG
ncbi:MAG: CDP-diacylglycerol--serine O-phosphatidyltransferase [Micrococcales bacterium]|nr:CDP-diacylglycerol--serine O-phosphatidyltransferase [Micrococcales bacterium]